MMVVMEVGLGEVRADLGYVCMTCVMAIGTRITTDPHM